MTEPRRAGVGVPPPPPEGWAVPDYLRLSTDLFKKLTEGERGLVVELLRQRVGIQVLGSARDLDLLSDDDRRLISFIVHERLDDSWMVV